MRSLDQAIKDRLEEKRQAFEKELAAKRERENRIIANEIDIANQAQAILSDCLEIDFSEFVVAAKFSHQSADVSYYKINIDLDGDNYVTTDNNVQAHDNILDVEGLLSVNWRAIHVFNTANRDCRTTTDTDLIEVLIFAKYGTTELEVGNE